ncbi:MAG: ExbD/TolR family protein [Puniceicoccaceae bacterium]
MPKFSDFPARGLTRPLNLAATVEEPRFRVDFVPFIDFFALFTFFAILSGRFVFSPGIALDLPTASEMEISGYQSDATLTVQDEAFIIDGGIYPVSRLDEVLTRTFGRLNNPESTLLVKISASTQLRDFTIISERARAAGFARVIIAVEEPRR